MLEQMREHRAELDAKRKAERKQLTAFFKSADQFIAKVGPPPKLDGPPKSFIQPPPLNVVLGKQIRSDIGKPHNFRGRPGHKLTAEEIAAHEA